MKTIELSKGYLTFVDDEDYEWLTREYRWRVTIAKDGRCYAHTTSGKPMHRLILEHIGHNLTGRVVDHADGDGLNNTRQNIRPATMKDNSRNRKMDRRNTTGFKGVTEVTLKGKTRWNVQIGVDNGAISYGLYDDPYTAAAVYNLAAEYHFGEFACFNELPMCLTVNPLFIDLPVSRKVRQRVIDLFSKTIPNYRGQLGNWQTLAQKYTAMHNERLKTQSRVIPFTTTLPAPIEEKSA